MKPTYIQCGSFAMILSAIAGIGLAEIPVKLPSVDLIIERNIKALGGEKSMRRLQNREARGTIQLTTFGAEMPVLLRHAAPNREMMELTIDGIGTVLDVFDGLKGWTQTPDGNITGKKKREVTNKVIDADFYAYLHFRKNYPKIQLLGLEKFFDKMVYAVKMIPKEGDADTFYFDTATGLVSGVASTAEIQGIDTKTKVLFRDYKKVDGVRVPHTLELVEPSFAAFTIRLNSVKHNVKDTANWFRKIK